MGFFADLYRDIGDHWHIYATMPLIAALIGYVTKLVAVEMMFRPLEYRGFKPFGWQGLIPRYAPRMATTAVDLMLSKLIDPQELLAKIDPAELTRRIEVPLVQSVDEVTREVMAKYRPTVWEVMPEFAKRLVIKRIQVQAPKLIAKMTADLRTNLDSVFDLRQMAITTLTRDKALMVRLIRDISEPEMKFIVRSGLVFGFLLGFAQVFVWSATHITLLMPAFGFFVGYSTDWLALRMIFRPVQSRRFFGVFRWQGLFHKRREQVAVDYGSLIADEILTPRNIIEAMLTGPQSDRLFGMIDKEVQRTVDAETGLAKPWVVLTMGGRRFQEMKQYAADVVLQRLPETTREVEAYAMEALGVRQLVIEKMRQMTPGEYEGLLRPAFKQDEWKLVLIGGVLGGIIGELQVLLLLH